MGPKKGLQRLQEKAHQPGRKRSSPATKINSYLQDAPSGEDEQWFRDMAILRRAAEERAQNPELKTAAFPASADGINPFAGGFEYFSAEEQSAIVLSLYERSPDRAALMVNAALRQSSPGQRRRIGTALVSSGLVSDAIAKLTSEKNGETYAAFSLLFLAAKAGEIDPLVQVIETHGSVALRVKLIGLLVSSGEREILEAFRRLAVNQSLAVELHSTIVQAIDQLNGPGREGTRSEARPN